MRIKIDRKKLKKLFSTIYMEDCLPCDPINSGGFKRCIYNQFADLLESHPELIVSDRIEAPVITTYSLKQEYKLLLRHYTGSIIDNKMISVPEEFKKYYDVETKVDYSKIPVGAAVEINDFDYLGIVERFTDNIMVLRMGKDSQNLRYILFKEIKSLIILHLPKSE